jgi:hypothetical protein
MMRQIRSKKKTYLVIKIFAFYGLRGFDPKQPGKILSA